MIQVREILYATDFSPQANQAYFHAVALARAHEARLTIVHVYTPPPPTIGAGIVVPPETGGVANEREHWRGQLEQIRPVDPAIAVRHVLLEGHPADEIVRYAAESGADLVVLGTHGRTGLERLLMGSVTESVLRGARCSVLAVKMPQAPASAGPG